MPKKHPKEDRSRKVSTSSQRSGETVSSRPLGSTSESEEPIELLSPKHNGNSVDSSIKQHNKSSIKGMWKKAFRSIRSNKPKDGEKDKTEGDRDSKHSRTSSRQSSLKRVLRRKDSKEEKPEEEYSRDEVDEIDPVYSLLKCAADLPRQGKHSGGPGHACCLRASAIASESTLNMAAAAAAARTNSRSSSPSSGDSDSRSNCSCPCHTPEVLENYHASLIKNRNRKT